MVNILDELEEVIGKNRIRQNELLAEHTLLKKGGSVEFYTELDTTEELIKLVRKARSLGMPVVILGGGSKIVIPDEGIQGLVIKNLCRRFDKMSIRGKISEQQIGVSEVLVSAESGALMNQLVRFTIEEGLEGLEYQLGLPGTVGGAIYTNAKFKNIYARSYLYSVSILNEQGELQSYTKDLPYFLPTEEDIYDTKDIIISAVFKLIPNDKAILWERGREAGEYRNEHAQRLKKDSVIAKP